MEIIKGEVIEIVVVFKKLLIEGLVLNSEYRGEVKFIKKRLGFAHIVGAEARVVIFDSLEHS